MKPRGNLGLYGNTVITRGYCSECASYAFIMDGKLQCCDKPSDEAPTRYKRISDCSIGRRKPSKKWQHLIMEEQKFCCFYCDRRFGATVFRAGKSVVLRINWDHVNPYAYSLNNHDQNFVAACHVCNGIKSSLVFRSTDEARTHIASRWQDKGYSDLSSVRVVIPSETPLAGVLQQAMPT